jgi:acylglycerol lipase
MNQASFEGVGGLKISTRSWRPAAIKARAVVIIVPGFKSHSGYYTWAAEQLMAKGLAVYALDLRGRGNSEGERFYVEKFGDYVNDVATLVTIAKSQDPGLKVFLLGHSAGGVVSCLYALDYQPEIAGLICESFAYELPAPDFALAVLKGLSQVAPHAHVLKLRNEWFSRDSKVVESMNNDPLLADEVQPTQTIAGCGKPGRIRQSHGLADTIIVNGRSKPVHALTEEETGEPDRRAANNHRICLVRRSSRSGTAQR